MSDTVGVVLVLLLVLFILMVLWVLLMSVVLLVFLLFLFVLFYFVLMLLYSGTVDGGVNKTWLKIIIIISGVVVNCCFFDLTFIYLIYLYECI